MTLVEHFRELYRSRVLIDSLVRREVKARYRGSVIGFFWTLVNPLMLLLVYWLVFRVFTRGVQVPNYTVFLFVGILPWQWLSSAVTSGSTSIIAGGSVLSRVAIPPQVFPAVTVLSNLVNFVLGLPIAIAAAAAYGIYPGVSLLLLPVAIVIQLSVTYGLALIFGSLAVRFRDVQFLAQTLIMLWFFVTPIVYPLDRIPPQYRALVLANPATPVVLPYQEILYRARVPDPAHLAIAAGWAILMLAVAVHVFASMRNSLVESL